MQMPFSILVYVFESETRLIDYGMKNRGHSLLFVISSLESLLPPPQEERVSTIYIVLYV